MGNRVARPERPPSLRGRAEECALLDELLADIRGGESRALVLRGEAGIGKTALLEYLVESASDVTLIRGVGVESEMELAYSSLHQICAPLLDRLAALPGPQRVAAEIVFGLSSGPAPDRFLVGLAVLSLLSEVSEERPVLCVADDAQWLDASSTLTLAFVARRLLADRVGMVFATRDSGHHLGPLPQLALEGLHNGDARALLSSAVQFGLDGEVRERIIAETRGNPLALLELPRGLAAAELAGFGASAAPAFSSGLEESFSRRLAALPDATRQLLLIAAAEPLGEPTLVWRAAAFQGVSADAAAPAEAAGLCEFGIRVRFRHPLVRSAAYNACSADQRRLAHAAIAEVTDAQADPDRRAWHRALAATGPDDTVADELEQSAARARSRAGPPAAAVFLERSMVLTLDPARRAERALAAAEARFLAASGDHALKLAEAAERGPLTEFDRVRIEVLRGRVATMQRRVGDAPPLLVGAARRLEQFDHRLARETYRDAFIAATYAGGLARETGLAEVAAAIRSAPPSSDPASATDELLDAAALLVDVDYPTGAKAVQHALAAFRVTSTLPKVDLQWLWLAARLAAVVWDDASWDALSGRALKAVRENGVLALLPIAAALRVGSELLVGNLGAASVCVTEQDTAQEALGVERSPASKIMLAAYRGQEAEVARLDELTTRDAVARGDGQWVHTLNRARAILFNGLGRYQEALVAAQQSIAYPPETIFRGLALAELVEAAARCGQPDAALDALGRLAEMAGAAGTDWVRGVEARARALVSDGANPEDLYRQAVEHLRDTTIRTELARAHLVYGEWLRREGRRVDARTELRTAYELFLEIGMEAFADRTLGELQATGEHVRARAPEARDDLTAQELQIAELAMDGLSNPEIGARLFLSPRTVEWHLRHVFAKLGIRSRRELHKVLPAASTHLVAD